MSQDKFPDKTKSSQTGAKVVDMHYLVKALVKYNASDLHIKAGRPPMYRVNGKLVPAKMPEMSTQVVESIILGSLTPKQMTQLEERRQIDYSFQAGDLGRFRCNVYYQKGTISAAIRLIPMTVPNIDQIGVPANALKDLCQRHRGLLLITGSTGTGKSTTLAAMLQYLNETFQGHILTIEDPIEYVFRDIKASIAQREVGSDTHSFKDGVIGGLRQDPDVVAIGEMRDQETIQAALTAAETGHLVISTLHTIDARSTIERILDVFPSEAQSQIRIQLASTLIGVVSQQLVGRADGTGQVVACEIMVKSPSIEACILKNEMGRISEQIEASGSYYKMQTMDQALEKLVISGTITKEEALKCSHNPDNLRLRLAGVTREGGYDSQ
jgi:twitching motility protein PilT